jgi:23S rRNA (cytosine1962-C5)-methyltransferase
MVMNDTYITQPSADYELLDSGEGMRLERYGSVVISRPDPQVLWDKTLASSVWSDVHATFEHNGIRGKWIIKKEIPQEWNVSFGKVRFALSLLSSKHIGVFPEQSYHWKWLQETIEKEIKNRKKISVLNLFGYTGGASIACALAGAEVTHVDSSEYAIESAMKNRELSGLPKDAIRFIADDARKFVEREIRRGKTYDIILMDPPVYGKGAKKEVWKIEDDLLQLLKQTAKILSPHPIAVIINGYASEYSHITYGRLLSLVMREGSIVSGHLAIEEKSSGGLLTAGVFARWSK